MSPNEEIVFKELGLEKLMNHIPPIELYKIAIQKCFLKNKTGPAVEALRRAANLLFSCEAFREEERFQKALEICNYSVFQCKLCKKYFPYQYNRKELYCPKCTGQFLQNELYFIYDVIFSKNEAKILSECLNEKYNSSPCGDCAEKEVYYSEKNSRPICSYCGEYQLDCNNTSGPFTFDQLPEEEKKKFLGKDLSKKIFGEN